MKNRKGGLIIKMIVFILVICLLVVVVLKFPQEGKKVVKGIVDLGQAILELIIKIGGWMINKLINK